MSNLTNSSDSKCQTNYNNFSSGCSDNKNNLLENKLLRGISLRKSFIEDYQFKKRDIKDKLDNLESSQSSNINIETNIQSLNIPYDDLYEDITSLVNTIVNLVSKQNSLFIR